MSGLLRRLTRRRPATADETGPAAPASSEPAGAPAETPVEPGGDQPVPAPEAATAVPASEGDEQATQVIPATGEQTVAIPAVATVRDLPAGVDPTEYADAPEASAPRGKVRRRLRYLRRMRDLLLRDLGGFTYEIRRTAGGTADETQRRLLESKMKRIEALDSEVRGLEARLGEPHTGAVLREPGIGGACPECGELYASDAHYCARCGTPLDAKARARRDAAVAAAVQQTTGSHQVAEPAPASLLWAAGPRPAAKPEETAPEEEPQSELTSQWLTLPPRPETAEEEPPAAAESEAAAEAEAAPEPAAAAETETAAEAAAESVEEPAPPKPKRTRTRKTPAKPRAEAAPETQDAAPADAQGEPPAETRDETAETREETAETAEAGDAADEPPYEPAPNGRRQGDVPDPLTSQRDQAS
jgi:hypothetical protein